MNFVREGSTRSLGPIVIAQDSQSELHIQAIVQSGRRQLDIRVWRRGPSGFAPSRSALTLELADLDALSEGIAELLEASNGGRQVARVVWDKDEGRRLRAETEPFGTRFTARFGFWQRVRDTWKPAGDGLTVAAEQLTALQDVIRTLRPRLQAPEENAPVDSETVLRQEGLRRWPNPGADWLTAEPAARFPSPTGQPQVPERLTFHPRGVRITAVVEERDHEHLLVLCQWRREESLWTPEDQTLALAVPELDVLLAQLRQLADQKRPLDVPTEPIPCRDGNLVRIDAAGDSLQIQRSTNTTFDEAPDGASLESGEMRAAPDSALRDVGAEQTTEPADYLTYLSVPIEYLPRLGRVLAQGGMMLIFNLSEAERANLQREDSPAIAPAIEADAILLPLEPPAEWHAGEISSDAHHAIGATEWAPDLLPGGIAPPLDEADTEITSSTSSQQLQELPEAVPEPPIRRLSPLGEVQLGRHLVFLYLQEEHDRHLSLQWDGYSLQIPVAEIQHTLDALRDLYYDALRGRRGQVAVPGADLHLSVHNQGSASFVALEGEYEGKIHRLSIPTGQVPSFLNAGSTALSRLEAQATESGKDHS